MGSKNSGKRTPTPEKLLIGSLCRDLTDESVRTLAYIMRNGTNPEKLGACKEINDRAWGKPAQALLHSDSNGENLPPQQNITNFIGVAPVQK